jgi:nucleolysin TIA-1/TIAR
MGAKTLAYDDVYNQTSPTNSTVYVGNISQATTEDELRRAFGAYGAITEVRIFKQQGYAFMRFESKEAACHAICNMNNQEVCGVAVRCSWGRAADVSCCEL